MHVLIEQAKKASEEGLVQGSLDYPKPVQGRVVHIDADFLAYQVSAPTKDELSGAVPPKTFEDMQHNAKEAALHTMRLAGGTKYVCHVTPTGSDKGGRYDQAIQQEYQANRAARNNKPPELDRIRAYIAQELNGIAHMNQEADDGLAQAAIAAEDPKLHVTASKDKDLRMVPGMHLDPASGELVMIDDKFGDIWIDDSKSTKKLLGYGTKFFWAQTLMGDSADNIRGLPLVIGLDYQRWNETASYRKLLGEYDALRDADKTDKKRIAAVTRLRAAQVKTKPCGPVVAYSMIKAATDDRSAFGLVKMYWKNLEKTGHQFKHWKTGAAVSAHTALLSDMKLLWMRHTERRDDVIRWLKETVK